MDITLNQTNVKNNLCYYKIKICDKLRVIHKEEEIKEKMKIKVKLNYVYISCDVMINIYSEVKDLDVHIEWIYDLIDQIEWSLNILKKYKDRHYKELQDKYKKIGEQAVNKLIQDLEKENKKQLTLYDN